MATIKDAYELTSKTSDAGIKAATGSIKGLGSAIKAIGKIGAGPFKAMQAGLSGVGKVLGGVARGFGAFGKVMQGVGAAKQLIGSVFQSLSAASPKLAGSLAKVEASFQKLAGPVLKKLGDALAPAFDKLAKVMQSPTFKKFADTIGNLLVKGLNALLPILDKAFTLFGSIFGVLDRGLGPFNSLVAIIGQVMRAFGASDEQVSGFIDFMLKARQVIEQAWSGLQQIVGAVWNWISSNVIQPLMTAVQQMAAAFSAKWGEIQAAGQALWSAIQPILQVIIDKISEIWNAVLPKLVEAWQGIVTLVGPAIQNIADFVRTHFGDIKTVIETIFGGVKTFIETTINVISGIIKTVLQVLSGDWSGAWNTIKTTVETVWGGIRGFIDGAIKGIQSVLNILGDALRKPWEGLSNFVGGIWAGIKLWLWQAINDVIHFMNGLIEGFNNSVGRVTGYIEYIPYVTSLAKGGIAKQPVMAMVGDAPREKGGEVVAPLTDLLGMIQQAVSGGQTVINVNGPFGPGYTPTQAGAAAADGYVNRLRALGVKA